MVTVSDWVLLGRYAARLDYPTNAAEFQKADCAPRTSLGDGRIGVTDWVQAGRYAAGADAWTPIGGPTNETGGAGITKQTQDESDRKVSVSNESWFSNQTGIVSVTMAAQGNEAALGFSLNFDTSRLEYVSAAKGAQAGSATLHINANGAPQGRLGFALGLSAGTFAFGKTELVKVSFRVLPTADPIISSITFTDSPVPREVSNPAAAPLICVYETGTATLRPIPELSIVSGAEGLAISWPGWATNFNLQASSSLPGGSWTNVAINPGLQDGRYRIVVPAAGPALFYRLAEP
jgi:hypothetical protein